MRIPPQRTRRALCSLAAAVLSLGAAAHAVAGAGAVPSPSARRVLDPPLAGAAMTVVDGRLWVASRGAGLIGFERGARSMRFDLGQGLPSAVVQELASLPDGRLAAGTQAGLVLLDPRKGSSTVLAPPGVDASGMAADLVLAGSRGSAIIFQLTPREADGAEGPAASSLWQWDGVRVQPWDPGLGAALVATAGTVDGSDGCFHLAGMQGDGAAQQPWYARQCGATVQRWRLAEGVPAATVGIAAIARAPDGRSTALVMVTQPAADPVSRRHVVMNLDEDGRLTPHCSHASFKEAVTGLVHAGTELIVARAGAGVHALGCGETRALSADARVNNATALLRDPRLGLLVATDAAVWHLAADGALRAMTPEPGRDIPIDALPMASKAAGTLVLLSSPSTGPLELARTPGGWRVVRQWQAGIDLPAAVYGPAAYAGADQVLVVQLSQGLLRLRQGQTQALPMAAGALPLDVAVTPAGTWVASGATPFGGAAGLHYLGNDGAARFIALPDRQAQPSGRLLAWPDGRIWAGTRLGIIEADATGAPRRLSADRVEALYRNDARNVIGAVGASVQRWDGAKMVPVLFAIEPRPARPLGHPVDLVIDDAGRWVILFSGGQVLLLDEQQHHVATLDERAGIPPTSRRLLYVPGSREVLIGSAREGLFSLTWP